MDQLKHYIYDWLINRGISEDISKHLNMVVLLVALLLVAFIVDYVTKRLLWRFFAGVAKRTETNFDDILIHNKLPRAVAHIIPLVLLIEFVPDVFSDFTYTESIIENTLKVIAVLLALQIIRRLLHSIRDYFCLLYTSPSPRDA